jgi:hypothetical protein
MPYYSEKRPARSKSPGSTAKQSPGAGRKPQAVSQTKLERVLEKIRRGRDVKRKVGMP